MVNDSDAKAMSKKAGMVLLVATKKKRDIVDVGS